MARWTYVLNLSDIFNEELSPFDQYGYARLGKIVARRIKLKMPNSWQEPESEDYDQDLADIIDYFESITGFDRVTPEQEFNMRMDELYDYADYVRIWVQTT